MRTLNCVLVASVLVCIALGHTTSSVSETEKEALQVFEADDATNAVAAASASMENASENANENDQVADSAAAEQAAPVNNDESAQPQEQQQQQQQQQQEEVSVQQQVADTPSVVLAGAESAADEAPLLNLVGQTTPAATTSTFNQACCSLAMRHVSCATSLIGVSFISDYVTYTGAQLTTPSTTTNIQFTFDPNPNAKFWVYADSQGTNARAWYVNSVLLNLPVTVTPYAWYVSAANVSSGVVSLQPKDPNSKVRFVYYGTETPSGVSSQCANWNSTAICGDNHFGQLGIGEKASQSSMTGVIGFSTFTRLVSSSFHTLALVSPASRNLFVMGGNRFGELGLGDTAPRWTATPLTSTLLAGVTIADIAVGGMHSLLLLSDGRVMTFGRNTRGQLCNGNRVGIVNVPTLVPSLTNVARVSGGWAHTALVTSDNRLLVCGSNSKGQLGLGWTQGDTLLPTPVPLANVVDVSCGAFHTLARTNGSALANCCGGAVRHFLCANEVAGVPAESLGWVMRDTRVSFLSAPPSVSVYSANYTYTPIPGAIIWVLVSRGGSASSRWWVNNFLVTSLSATPSLTWYKAANATMTATLMNNRVVVQLADYGTVLRAVYYGLEDPTYMPIDCDPQVVTFGANGQGQLCSGNTDPRAIPGVVPRTLNHTGTTSIAAGAYHSFFLVTAAGTQKTPFGCGLNNRNQLGFSSGAQDVLVATAALATQNVTQIVSGYLHTAFLVQDKMLYTSGGNSFGQLGSGDFTTKAGGAALIGYSATNAVLGGGGSITAISPR